MKNFLVSVIFWVFATILPMAAQTNPYEIDDECYKYFCETELLVGKPGFEESAAALLRSAITRSDTKAQTLYYVERLKHISRSVPSKRPPSPQDEAKVVAAFDDLKQVANQFGYPQYFYYAYEILQNFYYNRGLPLRTVELVQEMHEIASERKDAYGLWMGHRYMVSLYVAQGDYITAKHYILESLKIYESSTDPVLRRQSVARLYCDLSDTYLIGDDSVRINVDKALKNSKQHLDTLRCEYHLAKIAAYEKKVQEYHQHRDYCLQDPSLPSISTTAERLFGTLDAIIGGTFDVDAVNALSFSRIREVKYIANVAEVYGYKDQAFEIERLLMRKFEQLFAESNQSKITELDARLGNTRLSVQLADKTKEVLNITRLVAVLLAVILVIALSFFLFYIRNLNQAKEQDERRIAELKDANEKVQLANAAKTRFVQNMSHEVRTPLNAIVGFSQLLSLPDGSFTENEKSEFSNHIVNNTNMLTMLLDDILSASAMDSGSYQINYEDGEVHNIAQSAINSAEHRLQPGVRLYYAPESEEPIVFRVDPRRAQQILINLLTNACKHTMEGEICLTSSLTSRPGFVSYAVTDTGTGVPPEQAEQIFTRFTKLNEFTQGSGLGLSICREIAGRMGASVYLDTSYTAGGARFVLELPLHPDEQKKQVEQTNTE
ncbi:MAG: HAMP domain-containing histidine kinase [Bacteroidales bacterium]|nr:HAMP domain-containing histidine kinase [Bacteroidales bacterium]